MWKKIAIVAGVLVLSAVGYGAWMMRSQAEDIPETLATVDTTKVSDLMLEGDGDLPDFRIADMAGKTIFIVVGDRESMASGEEKSRNLALNHWVYPDDVQGFIIGDAKGFELFKSKVTEIMGHIRPELRFPMYVDFKGHVFDTFRLPRGHAGTAVVGPEGKVIFRHSGAMDAAKIDELRGLLKASEPLTPPAPSFAVGELSNETCKGKVCLLANLSKPVARTDIPGIEGGFEGDDEEGFKRMTEPDLRLAGLLIKIDEKLEDNTELKGVVVGETDGITFEHLTSVAPADGAAHTALKQALKLSTDEPAMIVINAEGKVVFAEHGRIPMYKLGRVAKLLDIELDDRAKDEH